MGAVIVIVAILAIAGGVTYTAVHKAKVQSDIKVQPKVNVGYETTGNNSGKLSVSGVNVNGNTSVNNDDSLICEEIIAALGARLGVTFSKTNINTSGRYGARLCAYSVTTNGIKNPGGSFFAKEVQAHLVSQGWKQNAQFDADGVSGGLFVMEKNGMGIDITHRWKNMNEMCPTPAGGAIMCNPLPAEQQFELIIDIQRK